MIKQEHKKIFQTLSIVKYEKHISPIKNYQFLIEKKKSLARIKDKRKEINKKVTYFFLV